MKKFKEKIKKTYIDFILQNKKEPSSVNHFMDSIGEGEKSFYEHYSSFEAIKKEIWTDFITRTLEQVKAEEVYQEYSVREKLLSFFFTLIEILKEQRSFVVYTIDDAKKSLSLCTPTFAKGFREEFFGFANELIAEGFDTQELHSRPVISEKYPNLIWGQLVLVLKFWAKDESENFEKTDAAIEKSINLTMDLMGLTVLDQAFDLAKFLFQNK
ncbi:TetR family transcriptional regulator C-terminal domain-containing protein [Flammeovirgaceae bacterium SG7u.111]|nr:TetR family transcriptional regulator C-terminal domain-containing protein [Flammeovirgaceae bacterium SG7u.132]WPO37892.1 TetR family transcriptional regulator C-terminal domain-containing protein [Flammeovirgaceae bacterium SG7u.111]